MMNERDIPSGEYVTYADDERIRTVRVSDDGTREIVIERWLDRQHLPPRWRSKNYARKLNAGEIEYYRQRQA